MDIYMLVRGPLAWIALTVFTVGCLFRMVSFLIMGRREAILYSGRSFKGGLLSIMEGVLPFGAAYMHKRPVFTMVAFLFHVCVLFTPVFVMAHTLSWYESWNILWWSIPDTWADVMTVIVVISCFFFFVRRIVVLEARQVTRFADFVLLLIVLLPFLTGFLAYHQWGPYKPMLIAHILTGEVLLVTIPFSRLSHMVFFMFTRGYTGAEFGRVIDGSR